MITDNPVSVPQQSSAHRTPKLWLSGYTRKEETWTNVELHNIFIMGAYRY